MLSLTVFIILFILVQVFANIKWWNQFLPKGSILILQAPTVDYLLAMSLGLSFVSYCIYKYLLLKDLKISLSKPVLYYSLFLSILVWIDVEIMNSPVLGFSVRTSGFPWWQERVMAVSCFLPAPTFTEIAPNCYFINYAQLFLLSIFTAGFVYYISHMKHAKRKSSSILNKLAVKNEQPTNYIVVENAIENAMRRIKSASIAITLIFVFLVLLIFASGITLTANAAPTNNIMYKNSIATTLQNNHHILTGNNTVLNNTTAEYAQNASVVIYGNWAVDFGSLYGVNWYGAGNYQTPGNTLHFDYERQALSWLQNNGHNVTANTK